MLFSRNTWIFVQFVLWMVRCMNYCVCLKSITLCNCLSPSSASLAHFFPEYRGIRSKNTFNPANSQHNSVICHYRRKFFWAIFFSEQSLSEGEFLNNYLINVATCLFAYVKGALWSLRQFLITESPSKMMKNAYYFT